MLLGVLHGSVLFCASWRLPEGLEGTSVFCSMSFCFSFVKLVSLLHTQVYQVFVFSATLVARLRCG